MPRWRFPEYEGVEFPEAWLGQCWEEGHEKGKWAYKEDTAEKAAVEKRINPLSRCFGEFEAGFLLAKRNTKEGLSEEEVERLYEVAPFTKPISKAESIRRKR